MISSALECTFSYCHTFQGALDTHIHLFNKRHHSDNADVAVVAGITPFENRTNLFRALKTRAGEVCAATVFVVEVILLAATSCIFNISMCAYVCMCALRWVWYADRFARLTRQWWRSTRPSCPAMTRSACAPLSTSSEM